MKQPKKLTRNQKKLLKNVDLNPKEYSLEAEHEQCIVIVHKATGERMLIQK